MNESGRSQTGGRGTGRWLSVLTVAEVALAVILVAGAGWLVRSFENLRQTDAGFQPEQRVVFDVGIFGPSFRDNASVHRALDGLLGRLRGLSGVTAAGSTFNFPLRGGPENSLFVHFNGDPADAAHNYNSRQRIVSPGFFKAMGIQVIGGRDFAADDRPDSPRVAIVNRAFVSRYLSGQGSPDRAVHGRLSQARSQDRLDHRRGRRRCAAAFAERGRLNLPTTRRTGRGRRLARPSSCMRRVAIPTRSAPPSARKCGRSIRRSLSSSSASTTSFAPRSAARNWGWP